MFSSVQLFGTQWIVACQILLSMGFCKQEYWSGLPCSPPGDLPKPGIKPRSSTLQVDSLPAELLGKLHMVMNSTICWEALHDHVIPWCSEVSFQGQAKILLAGHLMCCYWTKSINGNQGALDHLGSVLVQEKIPSCCIFPYLE